MNVKKVLLGMGLATIWLLRAPAMAGETRSATIRPDQDNPAPTTFSDVQPEDTVYFNVNIITPDGYTFSHTGWDRSRSNPNFLWTRITDMNSKLVNTAWESGTTTVNSHGYWNGGEGGGSGEGGGGGGLIHRWATGVASTGDALGSDLVVKISPAETGVGNEVSGSAFGKRVSDGGEVAVKANWSVSAPGYFKSGHADTHSVQFSRDTAGEAQVTAVNNGPPRRSGSGSAMFVEVASISADPAVVCVGSTPEFTVTTSPAGYTNLVDIACNPNVPGAQEVIATCGSSSASTWVTVVEAASLSCGDVTSQTNTPGEEETLYIYVGGSNDTVTLTASLNPAADPEALEGCISWQNAEQSEEDPLSAEFPISTPSSSIAGTVVTFACGSSEVAIRIVVVAINLSYNGLPEETEDEPNEQTPGGFIILNDNDNAGGADAGQGNGTPDNQETAFAHPDPDLKAVSLSLLPSDMAEGTVTLTAPAALKVWTDAQKSGSASEWNLAGEEMPATMFIEGYSTGSGDLTLSYSGTVPCSDTAKMTVMKLELSMAEYLGVDLTDPTGKVSSATASIAVTPGDVPTNYCWTLTGNTVFTNDVNTTNTISTSTTVYETGAGSSSYKAESINVQVFPSGLSINTNFTVVKANISWPDLVETNEETVGAWVSYNGDDDDTNGVVDAVQGAMQNGIEDDDLVEITVNVNPNDLPTNEMVSVISEGCWLDRQKQTNAAGSYTSDKFPLTVFVEGKTVSQAPRDQSMIVSNAASGACDMVKYTVLKMALIPNYDRDDAIDSDDINRAISNETFRFWINDDDDSGYDDGNDIPGDGSADSLNGSVDGVRDLIDFFPVWVDIKDTLAILSTNEYDYVLKHAGGALNAFACNSFPASSNPDLKPNAFLYSTNFGNAYGASNVAQVTSSGVALPVGFLAEILNNDRGIVLLEGRSATSAPLVLGIRRKSDSVMIFEKEMPLQLSSVEDMYRHINLRPDSEGHETSTGEPENYPDGLCNSKNVFFVHGFHCDGEYARGVNAEMFKRLYWSGSRAKFWGITWQGDVGWPDALHYHDNVTNAFFVATNLAAQMNGISGEKVILAHSLGNMLVSSAIQDAGLSVSKYFMLNAAVANECYDPATFNDSTNTNYMQHDAWWGYNSNTWCSTWFRLFDVPDDRQKLTWMNRFPSVVSVAYNMYSSGDNVFEIYPGTPSVPEGWWDFNFERYAWQKQEMFKGRTVAGIPIPGGTSWAGWGFSGEYTMEQANSATPDNLRTNTVFRHEPSSMFSSNINTQTQNEILAQGVPALSYPVGLTNALIGFDKNYNCEVHKPNGWPRDDDTYGARWLHSDFKNMAYLYTYDLFNQLVSQGGLQ